MGLDERDGKTLSQMLERLKDLPVLPGVVVRLMGMSPDSEGYFDEVLALAETDPPFAARVVGAANSAASGPVTPVAELRHAVARLGARRIGEIVTGLAVTRVFVPRTASQRALWTHSITTAFFARGIASEWASEEVSPDSAYLGGLLHDLGRFIMFDDSPDELASIDESEWKTPGELIEAEQAICGFDHAELGWRACRRWEIPEAIANVVRNHHAYAPAGSDSSADHPDPATAVVQMADEISVLLIARPELLEKDRDELASALEETRVCGLWDDPPTSADRLADLLPDLKTQAEQLAAELGVLSP